MTVQTAPSPVAPTVIRDPIADHLLTPQNTALFLIDYQPAQVSAVASMARRDLVTNVVALAQLAALFGLPVVLTTVNVKRRNAAPTIPQLTDVLPNAHALDRSTMNAWEDPAVVAAVRATGRRKLIIGALWTEVCLTFPTLDALSEDFEVYPVVDAVGGTTMAAHDAAIDRVQHAGAQLTTWAQVACELQRDWARAKTANAFSDILFAVEG